MAIAFADLRKHPLGQLFPIVCIAIGFPKSHRLGVYNLLPRLCFRLRHAGQDFATSVSRCPGGVPVRLLHEFRSHNYIDIP